MFLVSLIFAYISAAMMLETGVLNSYGWGFIIGRAVMGVLLPFVIVYIPLAITRRGKQKFTKGAYVSWWVLFILISVMALVGSALPPNGN